MPVGKQRRGAFRNKAATQAVCMAAELVLLAGTAAAQTAPAAPAQIEQMVVTARRRAERQQRVPTAITALDSKQLQKQGVVNTNDLARAVPSLTIGGQTRSDSQFYLRGQTPGVINQGVHNNSSVTIYFLEVPTLTSGPGEFYDLQDVQVLKGPQGVVFGRNTTGGAIAVTINLPLNPVDGCCAEISNVSPAVADVLTITAINANTGDVIATSGLGVPATITVAASTAGGSAAATVKYKYTLNGFQPASGAAVNPRTWFRVQ